MRVTFRIDCDRHRPKPGKYIIAEDGVDALVSDRHLQGVADLEPPYRRYEGVSLDRLIEHLFGVRGRLILEAPCDR